MRGLVAALLACLVAACGDSRPFPMEEIYLSVETDTEQVELGKAFPLRVVRAWHEELVPDPWHDELLAPLVLRLEEVTTRERDGVTEETRAYSAYAFATGELTVPALSFSARSHDASRVVTDEGAALELSVAPALAADSPETPELPGEPLPLPFPWGVLLAALAVVLVAGVLVLRRLRARPPAPPPPPPAPPVAPDVAAALLSGLDALAARDPAGTDALHAWYGDAAALLREWVGARYAIGAPEHTSEEVVAAMRAAAAVPAGQRAGVASLLARCDAVKFAAAGPDAPARGRFVEDARGLVVMEQGSPS